jgi:UPF0716 family protein affecting phage T7 exclusion
MVSRAVLFGSALCLIVPGMITDLIGAAGALAVYGWHHFRAPARTA